MLGHFKLAANVILVKDNTSQPISMAVIKSYWISRCKLLDLERINKEVILSYCVA